MTTLLVKKFSPIIGLDFISDADVLVYTLKHYRDLWIDGAGYAWGDASVYSDHDSLWYRAWVRWQRNRVPLDVERNHEIWNLRLNNTMVSQSILDTLISLVCPDTDMFLDMSHSELKIFTVISQNTTAALLIPVVYVYEQIRSTYEHEHLHLR